VSRRRPRRSPPATRRSVSTKRKSSTRPATPETLIITRQTPVEDLPQLVRVEEAATWTDSSDWMIRESIRHGQLAHVRLGKLIRIPRAALVALINGGAQK
jgi:excisionase family DNA binding protein